MSSCLIGRLHCYIYYQEDRHHKVNAQRKQMVYNITMQLCFHALEVIVCVVCVISSNSLSSMASPLDCVIDKFCNAVGN